MELTAAAVNDEAHFREPILLHIFVVVVFDLFSYYSIVSIESVNWGAATKNSFKSSPHKWSVVAIPVY